MSDQQKRGATLFFGKAGCVNCHNSPSLNNMKFFAVGVKDLYQNPGESFATGPNDKRNLGREVSPNALKICTNSKYLNCTT